MAANDFGQRFVFHNTPAWHRLGKVVEQDMGAQDAFTLAGPYDVHLEALNTTSGLESGHSAIVRDPTPDDPVSRVFGVVKSDYGLITPQDVCEIWDARAKLPIETMGALGLGEEFFVSSFLGAFDVRGDEVHPYLLVDAPFTGNRALDVRITGIRVVCANTLGASRRSFSEQYRIIHDATAKERLGDWLEGLVNRAQQRRQALADLFNAFAQVRITREQASDVIAYAMPLPKTPRNDAPMDVMKERESRFERDSKEVRDWRLMAEMKYDGAGIGSDSEAMKGTAWGAYNAVSEVQTHRKGQNEKSQAEAVLFGYRANSIERAFDACASIAVPSDSLFGKAAQIAYAERE